MRNQLDIFYDDKEHEAYGEHIQAVLDRIPDHLARRLCRKCVIIIMGTNYYGQYHTGISKYLIILNPQLMETDKMTPEQIRFVIAHEFAHFYKQHDTAFPDTIPEENEADQLAAEWGFPVTWGE